MKEGKTTLVREKGGVYKRPILEHLPKTGRINKAIKVGNEKENKGYSLKHTR